jgi:hypothetical protein
MNARAVLKNLPEGRSLRVDARGRITTRKQPERQDDDHRDPQRTVAAPAARDEGPGEQRNSNQPRAASS